jgi:hypothetical protein
MKGVPVGALIGKDYIGADGRTSVDRNGRAVLDRVLEKKPPFSPETVVSDFAALLKAFRVRDVHGRTRRNCWTTSGFGCIPGARALRREVDNRRRARRESASARR